MKDRSHEGIVGGVVVILADWGFDGNLGGWRKSRQVARYSR
ncbi:hypothetical protein [Lysinibacillus composti]|nr:hypothetical protein [Lysinibacillus composti]